MTTTAIISKQALQDVATDAASIGYFANNAATDPNPTNEVGAAGTVTARLGSTYRVLSKIVQDLQNSQPYQAPVAFTSGLEIADSTWTVEYLNKIYVALPTSVPFTTTGTFNPADWSLLDSNKSFDVRNSSNAAVAAAAVDGTIITMGGITYIVDSASTGSSSATNDFAVDGLLPFGLVFPEHFGADGTLSTESSFWTAVAYAQSIGAELNGRSKTYAITSKSITTPGKLIWKNIFFTTADTGSDIISVTGGLFTNRTLLAADAAFTSDELEVTTTTEANQFVAGDDVLVMSERDWCARTLSDNIRAKASEDATVKSVSGTTITLQSGLRGSYTVANTARVLKMTMDITVDFKNVRLTCDLNGERQTGFSFALCRIDNAFIQVHNTQSEGVAFRNCILEGEGRIDANDTYTGIEDEGSFGYPLKQNGCWDRGHIWYFIRGERGRHLVAGGASGSSPISSDSTDAYIVGRGLHVVSWFGDDWYAAPLDIHPGHDGGYFGPGVANLNGRGGSSEAGALTMQGTNFQMAGGRIYGTCPGTLHLQFQQFGYGDGESNSEIVFQAGNWLLPNQGATSSTAIGINTQYVLDSKIINVLVESVQNNCDGFLNIDTRGAVVNVYIGTALAVWGGSKKGIEADDADADDGDSDNRFDIYIANLIGRGGSGATHFAQLNDTGTLTIQSGSVFSNGSSLFRALAADNSILLGSAFRNTGTATLVGAGSGSVNRASTVSA